MKKIYQVVLFLGLVSSSTNFCHSSFSKFNDNYSEDAIFQSILNVPLIDTIPDDVRWNIYNSLGLKDFKVVQQVSRFWEKSLDFYVLGFWTYFKLLNSIYTKDFHLVLNSGEIWAPAKFKKALPPLSQIWIKENYTRLKSITTLAELDRYIYTVISSPELHSNDDFHQYITDFITEFYQEYTDQRVQKTLEDPFYNHVKNHMGDSKLAQELIQNSGSSEHKLCEFLHSSLAGKLGVLQFNQHQNTFSNFKLVGFSQRERNLIQQNNYLMACPENSPQVIKKIAYFEKRIREAFAEKDVCIWQGLKIIPDMLGSRITTFIKAYRDWYPKESYFQSEFKKFEHHLQDLEKYRNYTRKYQDRLKKK